MSILDWYRRTQYTVGTGDHPVIESLKKQAKQFHRQHPRGSLMDAQNKIAQDNGFMHWHHAQQIALNYKDVYARSLQSKSNWGPWRDDAHTKTRVALRGIPSRWLGLDEMGPWHVGQREHTQRMHTLVMGQAVGPMYLHSWLHEDAADSRLFMAWINISAWPTFSLNIDAALAKPLMLRLGTSNIGDAFSAQVHAVEVYWQDFSEMHAWVNILRPDLSTNASSSLQLSSILTWLWEQPRNQYKTPVCFGSFLQPNALVSFPGWILDPHATLLLAGELALLFRNAQPFNAYKSDDAHFLTIDEWLRYSSGVIILDDGQQEHEMSRRCVQAWIRSNIGHRLGVSVVIGQRQPVVDYAVRQCGHHGDLKSCPPNSMHFYFANIELSILSNIPSQCRALGMALTYFYNTEPPLDCYECLKHNTATKLIQSTQSSEYVWYSNGHDNAAVTPLRIADDL